MMFMAVLFLIVCFFIIKQIEGLSKQTLSIVSTSGQGSVYNGSKIIVSLPMNSLLDLGTNF